MIPRYFFEKDSNALNRIYNKLKSNSPVILFLDYDGTVVPIKQRPSLAVLSSKMRELLKNLAKHPNIFVGFVTGRSLTDIKSMARLKGISYIANHGFQISLPWGKWIHPDVKQKIPILKKIFSTLKNRLKTTKGVFIENKSLTLSIHYRNTPKGSIPHIKKTIRDILNSHGGFFRITNGKKVVEIRPNILWDKGCAVMKVLEMFKLQRKPLIIYIGDDKTDEDAFRILRSNGITIHVGRTCNSQAGYFLNSPSQVKKLLESINLCQN